MSGRDRGHPCSELTLSLLAPISTTSQSGLGSFSKASFAVSAGNEVSVDDPDFWTKVVGIKAMTTANNELKKERSCKRYVSRETPGKRGLREATGGGKAC